MLDSQFIDAATRYGTPIYVYNMEQVRTRAAELFAALPSDSRLLYSVKANPLPPICEQLRVTGCQAEISSVGELRAALDAGYSAPEMLYTGPGKTPEEIAVALQHGVTRFSVESTNELHRLAAAATGREASALLRLQPVDRPSSGLSMSDGRQFGFLIDEAIAACGAGHRGVRIEGFHVFAGAQINTVDALTEGFAIAKETVEEVCDKTGFAPAIVDLGGGFGWPHSTPGAGGELDGLSTKIAQLNDKWTMGTPRLWFESGRRLVGSSGWLVTRVLDVKERADRLVVIVDAGINVLGGMAGLGRVLRPSAAFVNLSTAAPHDTVTADVVGPLCTPLDRLSVNTVMARPGVGDLLCVPNVGAYGLTASLTGFLSRPPAAEVVFDGELLTGVWQLEPQRRVDIRQHQPGDR